MGLVAVLTSVKDETFRKIERSGPSIWELTDTGFEAVDADGEASTEISPVAFETDAGEGIVADLDKAWHGLHFCLTGTSYGGVPPLNFIAAGGTLSAAIMPDMGVRYFSSSEVREIAASLAKLTVKDLRNTFDPAEMKKADIYPDIWDREEEDFNFDYIEQNFEIAQDFAAKCAEANCGFLICIG